MATSARALTGAEWEVLLDLDSGASPWLAPDAELISRLAQMGLVSMDASGNPVLTWTGREFVELRKSGLYSLVNAPSTISPEL
jgi:hypothetical protein